jgi:hypothetical protein
MKLKDKPEIEHLRDFKDVEIRADFTLRVYATPWNFEDRLATEVPPPDDADDNDEYQYQRIGAVLHGCLDEDQVTWDAEIKPGDSFPEFYLAICHEIIAFLTPKQAMLLAKTARTLGSIDQQDIEDARADFLSNSPTAPTEEEQPSD